MKQRITYIVPNPDEYNPETLQVTSTSFTLENVKAVKEHRITFGLDELPAELRKTFEQWHELHIRWASSQPYTTIPPFTSRVSPGLHVFFTPQAEQPDTDLCPLLTTTFGHLPKCTNPSSSFTTPPILSPRFSASPSSQFYALVPNLDNLVSFIQTDLCSSSSSSCKSAAQSLQTVSSLDIDYDTISHALVLKAFWSSAPNAATGWTETITLPGQQAETIEIGVLNRENNPDPEDIQFAGFLAVLGRDTKPKPTLFQSPARHYPLPHPQTYTTTLAHPTGLHPTLHLTFPSAPQPPHPSCTLHTHLTLPSYLFIDRYQFHDPLALSSYGLTALRSLSGATDLEAPDWMVDQWGSAALFEIASPHEREREREREPKAADTPLNVSIPLHLRYLPATYDSHTRVALPWPVIFWACAADEGTKFATNPFDRVDLGYDGLFGARTRFMHLEPAGHGDGAGLVEYLDVPVLDLRGTDWVEWGTGAVVVGAFLLLSWVMFRPLAKWGTEEEDEDREGKKEQ